MSDASLTTQYVDAMMAAVAKTGSQPNLMYVSPLNKRAFDIIRNVEGYNWRKVKKLLGKLKYANV